MYEINLFCNFNGRKGETIIFYLIPMCCLVSKKRLKPIPISIVHAAVVNKE